MNIPHKYSVTNIQTVCSSMNIPDRYHVKEYFVFRKLAMTHALLEYSGYPEYLENSHSWQQDEYLNEQIFSLKEYLVEEKIFRQPYE